MTAFQLYMIFMILLLVTYVLTYEPVDKMQRELFSLMNPTFVDHYEYPSTHVDGIRPIPTVQPVSIDGSVDNQHVTGWKKQWKDNYSNDASADVATTTYMDYTRNSPLIYDGVRPN